MEYVDHVETVGAADPALAARIRGFVTLEHVLTWLSADGYPLARLDMVTQDEYSHDLLIPLPGSADWLIFGMT